MNALHLRTGGFIKRVQKELGQPDSKGLQDGLHLDYSSVIDNDWSARKENSFWRMKPTLLLSFRNLPQLT
jgi:hypothetical protein